MNKLIFPLGMATGFFIAWMYNRNQSRKASVVPQKLSDFFVKTESDDSCGFLSPAFSTGWSDDLCYDGERISSGYREKSLGGIQISDQKLPQAPGTWNGARVSTYDHSSDALVRYR